MSVDIPPPTMAPALIYTIVVKPTMRCNLRCGYCYSSDLHGTRMSPGVLETLLDTAAELEADVVNIVWHGGEPLLAGMEFFRRAVTKQRELCGATGVHFVNALQTNGTLVTDDWAKFFAEHKFDIGVSLDGPAWIHDANRPGAGGRNSYDLAFAGFNRLRAAGNSPGVMSVIDPAAPPPVHDYFQWLKELKFPSLSLSPIFGNRAALSTNYGKFIADLFAALGAVGRAGAVREAHTLARGARGTTGVWDACHPGWPCYETTSAVDPEGNIYFACDRFMDGPGSVAHRVGHVASTGFRNIGANRTFRLLAERANHSLTHCNANCSHAKTCSGGCIADWMLSPPLTAALRPKVAFCEGVAAAHTVLEG